MTEKNDSKSWYRTTSEEALERLDAHREGLSGEEADSRLARHGPNTIQTEQKVSAAKVLLDQFTNPLIYILLAALAVTLGIHFWGGGGSRLGDVIVISLVLVVNATVGFIQEYRAESAVQSLMQMVSPKAKVRRDGREQEIAGDQLVPGDIVLLGEGDMVPADARLLNASALQINESALTGESVPASKREEALSDADENLPPGDQTNMVFMGTAVTSGRAEGVLVATGRETQLGEIAQGVREAGESKTPLQRRMDRLAKWIAAGILLIASAAFGVGVLMQRSIEQMFLLAVSLSVAAIPAGLPVVMTVALAIGVRRMARRHAVIRHLPAVETLGSTTTIVADKTGTLTQNRMTVKRVFAGDKRFELGGEALSTEGPLSREEGEKIEVEEGTPLYYTLLSGLLNNEARLERGEQEQESDGEATHQERQAQSNADQRQGEDDQQNDSPTVLTPVGDPMEAALLIAAAKAGLSRNELQQRYEQIDEVPFQTERRFSATIHKTSEGDDGPLVLIKGAPEVIFAMCEHRLTAEGDEADVDRDRLQEENDRLASQGLRVLAMAIGRGEQAAESIKSDEPRGMTLVGMQGLMDPPRPEAIEAIDQCHDSGIRVLMVTGDHARTAAAIARQVHLDRPARAGGGGSESAKEENSEKTERAAPQGERDETPEAPTGQDVDTLEDTQLDDILASANVFARVKPNQKLRLVERLKSLKQVVAVTGDGVNDAPALKAAHLGAAMGQTGTDVAKEASDMVITDDDLGSVYSAVEEGRTAFRNIRMATFFLLSTGAADVLIILTALGFDWALPLLPAQILWCNVVTNGIADVALGFEPGEKDLFRRPPRPVSEGVLDRALLERLVLVGVWLAAGVLGVFYWIKNQGDQPDLVLARTAALTTLVLFQKVHVFNCRSEDVSIFKKSLLTNKVLLIGVLTSLVIHIAALYIPWTQTVLSVKPLPWYVWAAITPIAATAIIVNELHKRFRPREVVNQSNDWFSRWLRGESGKESQGLNQRELQERLEKVEETVQRNHELLEEVAEGEAAAPEQNERR